MNINNRTFVALGILIGGITASQLSTHEPDLCIVAFGDSTTDHREDVKQVYTDRLPELLRQHGIYASVLNSGMGGSHTGHRKDHDGFQIPHARDRFQSCVIEYEPDIVIMQFGANDAWVDSDSPEDSSRIPVEDYRQNLLYLTRKFQQTGARVIFITPMHLSPPYEPWRNERMGEYAQTMRLLAAELESPVIDLWNILGDDTDGYVTDGAHPNDQTHALVADRLTKLVRDLVENESKDDYIKRTKIKIRKKLNFF